VWIWPVWKYLYDITWPISTSISPASGTVWNDTLISLTCNDWTWVWCFNTWSYYRIMSDDTICPTTWYIQYSWTSFTLTWIDWESITRKICAYSKDILWTTWTTSSWVYTIDMIYATWSFNINSWAEYTTTWSAILNNMWITWATLMRFSNWDGSRSDRTWFSNYFSRQLSLLDGSKVVSGQFDDGYDNIYETSAIIIMDTAPPSISTWYISSWLTWANWSTLYYKWVINIRANISDWVGIWLSWNTCQYNTGWLRTQAVYSWAWWYCEITWLNYQSDFIINFRIQDSLWNQWIWTTWIYIYDNIVPSSWSFNINNSTSIFWNFTNTTWVTINVSCPVDTWISNLQIAYGNSPNPDNWTMCTDII
jgi:hypothetical protein